MERSQLRFIACVVDTDVAIDFLRNKQYATELFERWRKEGLLAVSAITHTEIVQGMRPHEEELTNAFLSELLSLVVDVPIARRAGMLLSQARVRGRTVGIADAIIGATALGLGVPLLTNNVEHYIFPGLEVVRGLKAT